MAEKMTGAKLFARMLQAYGVTHVFFMDAILRRVLAEMEDVGIKRILGHSEKAVAYMADGYARVTGRPGVCMAQSVGRGESRCRHAGPLPRPLAGGSRSRAATSRRTSTAMPTRNCRTSRCTSR
jgi:acetolactate synthase-1/2/3 large subunit